MRELKNKKGITLVALVVTIIILLILAGISIATLTGSGLFENAKLAEQKSKEGKNLEETRLGDYEKSIAEIIGTRDETITINTSELSELITKIVRNEINTANGTPTGSILAQMGNEAPSGYLFCDGNEYNVKEYKNLADYIKLQFGSVNYFGGDGTTTFAVPNLNNKFLKGQTASAGINEAAGLPNISGGFSAYTYSGGGANGPFSSSISNDNCLSGGSGSGLNFNNFNFNASKSNSIYGNSTTVTPENVSVSYCIKY